MRTRDGLGLPPAPALSAPSAKPRPGDTNHDEWVGTCGESDLAWQLADAISAALADDDRAHLYAAIGVGESYDAVDTALETVARDSHPVAP